MSVINHTAPAFRQQWIFPVLSLLALFLAYYTYSSQPGDFRMFGIVMSSAIFSAGLLKILFSGANRINYKRASWYLTGGLINITLSTAFFFYYLIYNNHPEYNKVFLAYIGCWLLMHSFLNFAFAKELVNVYVPAVLPLLVTGIIGAFASLAVILFSMVQREVVITVIIITLIVIAIYNCWIYLYMRKNPVRN